MKILITTGLFPPDIGGPATYVPRIAESLSNRGHEITVVAPRDRGVACPITDPPYRLVRFYRPRFMRYVNYFIELRRALAAILREVRTCEMMFVNGLNLPAMLVSRLTGKPMVVKVVGDSAWELAHNRGWTDVSLDDFHKVHGLRIDLFRKIRLAAAKRSEVVITPSRYLADIVEEWGVPTRYLRVVHNAFVAPSKEKDELPGLTIPPNLYQGLRLVTVGRLVLHKRVSQIITVLKELGEAKLVIVGDGPQRQELERLVDKLILQDRVFFTGQVPQDYVWSVLTRYADALILNSTYEGFPHILLEAAHFGVPVVATAVGGTPELVQDGRTGLLIPPDASKDLFAALKILQLDARLRRQLAINAKSHVARFSFECMVEETEKVLMETVR
jgi:glycosyltransferase involved in cell wall biosynthesis